MLKFLLLFLITTLILRKLLKPTKKVFTRPAQNFRSPQAKTGAIETLLPCPRCGTFFRQSQGTEASGQWFCSTDCAFKT